MTNAPLYQAFGLHLCSDRPLPWLQLRSTNAAPVEPEVSIRFGAIGDSALDAGGPIICRRNWRANTAGFLLQVDGVAQFLVQDGSRILIEAEPGASQDEINAYLMGSAIAALLQQRRILTLHASAIDTPKGAVLFLGPSGIGKSTLLAAMQALGYSMLSDDISALRLSAAAPAQVLPAYPALRLQPSSLNKLGQTSQGASKLSADKDKYVLAARRYCRDARPLARAFLLTASARCDVALEPLPRSEQFRWLTQFTFRKNYYQGHGLTAFHFDAVQALAQRDLLARLERPKEAFEIDAMAELVAGALA